MGTFCFIENTDKAECPHYPSVPSRDIFSSGEMNAARFQPKAANFDPEWGFQLVATLLLGAAGLTLIIAVIVFRLIFGRAKRSWQRRRLRLSASEPAQPYTHFKLDPLLPESGHKGLCEIGSKLLRSKSEAVVTCATQLQSNSQIKRDFRRLQQVTAVSSGFRQ